MPITPGVHSSAKATTSSAHKSIARCPPIRAIRNWIARVPYFIANRTNSGVIGTMGANVLRTGGTNNTSLAFVKNLRTRESQNLQLRWEVTNVFNHRNFTTIPQNMASDNTNQTIFLNLGQTNIFGRSMIFTARYSF